MDRIEKIRGVVHFHDRYLVYSLFIFWIPSRYRLQGIWAIVQCLIE